MTWVSRREAQQRAYLDMTRRLYAAVLTATAAATNAVS
jgi:hypothetical protein